MKKIMAMIMAIMLVGGIGAQSVKAADRDDIECVDTYENINTIYQPTDIDMYFYF